MYTHLYYTHIQTCTWCMKFVHIQIKTLPWSYFTSFPYPSMNNTLRRLNMSKVPDNSHFSYYWLEHSTCNSTRVWIYNSITNTRNHHKSQSMQPLQSHGCTIHSKYIIRWSVAYNTVRSCFVVPLYALENVELP